MEIRNPDLKLGDFSDSISVKSSKIVEVLESNGWVLDRSQGSHATDINESLPGRITTVLISHRYIEIEVSKNLVWQSH